MRHRPDMALHGAKNLWTKADADKRRIEVDGGGGAVICVIESDDPNRQAADLSDKQLTLRVGQRLLPPRHVMRQRNWRGVVEVATGRLGVAPHPGTGSVVGGSGAHLDPCRCHVHGHPLGSATVNERHCSRRHACKKARALDEFLQQLGERDRTNALPLTNRNAGSCTRQRGEVGALVVGSRSHHSW